jgi:cation transport ATPase
MMVMLMTQMFQTHTLTPVADAVPTQRFCRHCQSKLDAQLADEFCCHGCRTAYELIESFELKRFYEIVQENRDSLRPAGPQKLDYRLFDAAEFQEGFVEKSKAGQQTAHFYLENMSCYACVWVCEQVTKQIDPEASLSINLSSGEATLDFKASKVALSEFLSRFETMGFPVSPNSDYQQDEKQEIARIGVALFCVMNIMMLAFPEYLGAESLENRFRDLFRWISTVLAALSVFYSGWPFIRGALTSLRRGQLHLDLPIGLALVVCFFYSLVHTWQGHPHVYYDSTAAVVALLLIGRWAQGKALRRIMREKSKYFASEARFVRVLNENDVEAITPLASVGSGQSLKVLAGEVVPLRAELVSECAEINRSLLTGEADWLSVHKGQTLEAGSMNGGQPIVIRSLETGLQSFLLRLQNAAQTLYQHKGGFAALSENMAKAFVIFVLTMAFGSLAWHWEASSERAITRFATVLLIACPCIFGFGAPMVLSRALLLGLQRGVLFRSQNALERLALVQNFFFDKTGTLTEDDSKVSEAQWNEIQLKALSLPEEDLLELFRKLPDFSAHHSLAALAAYAGPGNASRESIKAVREVFGQGISLVWRGAEVRIGRFGFCFQEPPRDEQALEYSYVSMDRKNLLRFRLQDQLRPDSRAAVHSLLMSKRNVFMLTGDSLDRAQAVGHELGLDKDHVVARLSPNEKLGRIDDKKRNAMVGNGINDTLAMAQVEIGIAVANATESLREKADIALLAPGLDPLMRAIELSSATRRALQRCFGFALFFNLIGMSLAISGWATPVLGAILMPISSFTIFAIARRWH